jgi:hypothetical protein
MQFMSDLHLEVGQQYATFDFTARCPYLILGGDIGRLVDYDDYLAFLERQAGKFRRIFLVLGNHEFYGLDYDTGIREARELVRAVSQGQCHPPAQDAVGRKRPWPRRHHPRLHAVVGHTRRRE